MDRLKALASRLPLSERDLLSYALVFGLYFVGAKIGLFLFYTFETSPALIWPPVGIALAAVIFGGYRMWFPIFLAQLLAVVSQAPENFVIAAVIAAAYAFQAVFALYVMRMLGFEPALNKLRNAQILVGVAFLVTLIEPMAATLAQVYLYDLATPLLNLGRAWGGGIFSALVIVPFFITWYPWKRPLCTRTEWLEIVAAFITLAAVSYFLFWTPYPQYFGIAVIFFLPAVLIWFALSLRVRWLTLALLLTSIFGIAGSIIASPGNSPLNAQLLADQIYIGLLAPIFILFVTVVEERRTAYKRLRTEYESTYAADKAKNEFIAILAHELRNPLAPIVSSLELLKLEPQTDDALKTIHNAEEHTTMIRRLLDDLLDTARLSQQKFKLQKEPVSLRDVIDQSIASVSEMLKSKNHTLNVSLPAVDIVLSADPVRLKQIVINLLNNACKYTRPNGVIELRITKKSDAIEITISDSGIGISEEKLEEIFEPFKQVNAASKHSTGLGIGLFLTKRLVEMHDGTITAQSLGADRGSTFTVTLPLVEMPVARDTQAAPSIRVPAHKLLIVDDNEPAALALQKLLSLHGQEVQVAFSGRDALQRVGIYQPDIILLDLGMPEMNGYEVAHNLRALKWRGKIVALTGYGQEEDRKRSEDFGFYRHIVKPVAIKDILEILNIT